MSSGWGTGVSVGLLQGVNSNIAQQNKLAQEQQKEGMDSQLLAFREAAKEYDNEKREVSERTSKMQANASTIAGGAPDDMALALAYRFDQTTGGKRDLEGDLLDQAQRDYKYMKDNPQVVKKVSSGQMTPPSFNGSSNSSVPSNIDPQTMARYGVKPEQLNDVYGDRPNVANPSGVVPANAPMSQAVQQRIQEKLSTELPFDVAKSKAMEQAKFESESSPAAIEAVKAKARATQLGQLEAGGYTQDASGQIVPANQQQQPPQQQAPAAPPPGPQVQGAGNSMQVNASDLQPGAPAPAQPQQPSASGQAPTAQAAANPSQPAPAQPQAQQDTLPAYLKANDKSDKRNYDVLKQLTPEDAQYLVAVSNGQRAFSSPYLMARGDAVVKHLAKVVNQFDPSYSDNRLSNLKSFQTGTNAATITDLNTALNHMGILNEAGKALSQGNLPALNKIANAIGVQSGAAAPVVFGNISNYVSSELRKVYSGRNGGGLTELERIADGLDKAQSPEQRMGVLKSNANLLTGKINAIDHQYQGVMGDAYVGNNFLEPQAKKVYEELTKGGNSAGTPAPDGPDFSHLWTK